MLLQLAEQRRLRVGTDMETHPMAQTSRLQLGTPGAILTAIPSRWEGMSWHRTVCQGIVLASLAFAAEGAAAPTKGSRYLVEGRCVTITRVQGELASYAWQEELASGSGTLMRSHLTQPCQGTAAPESRSADGTLPRP